MTFLKWIVLVLILSILPLEVAVGTRIKDLASVRGARTNQLTGYGVVVGLEGSGDRKSELTTRSLALLLEGLGVEQKLDGLEASNAAAVMVTATLPAFARQGTRIDVSVSSMGNARSLNGGTLMMTSLKAPNGKVYAMAQGKIITPNRQRYGRNPASDQSRVSGRIPGGGLVEKEVGFNLGERREVTYQLINPDFTTAARMARQINSELGGKYASAQDAGTVHVIFPYSDYSSAVEIIARLESVEVNADRRAKVVINQRTGTVVLGAEVRVLPVAIAHDNLKVEIRSPASQAGATVANPNFVPNTEQAAELAASTSPTLLSTLDKEEEERSILLMDNGTTISQVVDALNSMGASADDLVSMVQSLKASGALMAEVVVQ